jgi:hypothetical protein
MSKTRRVSRELMGLTARGNVEGRIFKERDSWPLGPEEPVVGEPSSVGLKLKRAIKRGRR